MAGTKNAGRSGRLVVVLALLVLGGMACLAPIPADEPTEELTAAERAKLLKKAVELNNQAMLEYQNGRFTDAAETLERAIPLFQQVYPPTQFPDGDPELATGLSNLGLLYKAQGKYSKAEAYIRDALDMRKRLYSADKFPDGHPDLAMSLNNFGLLLEALGRDDKAEPILSDALDMERKLYSTQKFPKGNPLLATGLDNLGSLLSERGEDGKAEPLLREALDMRKRLYPADKFPGGHPDVARSLSNLGVLLMKPGGYGKAEPLLREALDMRKRLYPADKFPGGHPALAQSLIIMGKLLYYESEYAKAEPCCRESVEMCKRLYPAEKYPDGHPDLAQSISNLGTVLFHHDECTKAEPYCREAVDMYKRLYPPEKFPNGSPELAASLSCLGALLRERGQYTSAEPLLREAVDMYKRLHPPEKFHDGYAEQAAGLNDLGLLLMDRGEDGKAEVYLREALEMRMHLYPPDKFPDGHADLAQSLCNVGAILRRHGDYAKAEPLLRDAVDMYKRLYPKENHPDGSPDLASSLNNLGVLLESQGDHAKAEPLLRDAVDMYSRLYPAEKYSNGRSELAASLNNLGSVLEARDEYGDAEADFRKSLNMYRQLYPAQEYPDGYPDVAWCLINLGILLQRQGEHVQAAGLLMKGTAMYDRIAAAFAESAAEAEALNFDAGLPYTHGLCLAATVHLSVDDPTDLYPVLWRGKGTLLRVFERRRRLLQIAADADEKTQKKLQELRVVREELARLMLAPARPEISDRDQLLKDATEHKESLEKDLARILPASNREVPPFTDLADHLPDRAIFIDLYRYWDWNPKTRQWDDVHYAAFVLRRGRSVRRVELGEGASIEKDLKEWVRDIGKGFASDAAGRLRKSVWEPITKALGDDVDTVYICPDGDLAAMPWSALPGQKAGRVLLEDYAFATVPSGLFLLEQLTRPTPAERDPGVLLAVGGVHYDRDGTPADKAGKPWPFLTATDKERAAVAAQAGKLFHASEIIDRTGTDADVAHLLKDMPKARWAHLATHGFFAAKDTQEREHLFRPDDFAFGITPLGGRLDRRGAAARNPLTQSALVLAGANQPTDADTGLLTGEAIAGLDLDKMDLAVLSACQTGLGEQYNGEGVFGLQRAFHIAGAKNVVASLWSVDDDATAALMNLFYYHLWEKNEPPLEALHHAQLELYRNPRALSGLAKGRGAADWDDAVKVVTKPTSDPKAAPQHPAAVRDWAAFVLSGAGR